MELAKLTEIGEKFGFSGEELRQFVTDEQKRLREERADMLELRRQERETAELQLAIAREKQTKSESSSNGCKARSPKLPLFQEDKDNIDAYLQRFERYAKNQNWPTTDWALNLSTLLTGKALDVHSRLSSAESNDYDTLKHALLKSFQLTAEGFRSKFFSGKPTTGETASQYANRLENYLNRWVSLSGIEHTFEELADLLLREQLISGCHRELAIFLKERQPETSKDVVKLAEQYLDARGGTFRPPPPAQRNIQTHMGQMPRSNTRPEGKIPPNNISGNRPPSQPKCYNCHQHGHLARDCTKQGNRGRTCFICHKPGHIANYCPFSPMKSAGLVLAQDPEQGNPPISEHNLASLEPDQVEPNPHTPCQCPACTNTKVKIEASCMMVGMPLNAPKLESTTDHIQFKCGYSLPLMSAACTKEHVVRQMPVTNGLVNNNQISVLRDSGCSGAVIKQDLVQPTQMTGEESTCVLIDGTVKTLPVARIDVDTPFYVGKVNALCMKTPLYDLILGNLPGVREPDNPDPDWTATPMPVGAVQTRAQAQRDGKPFRPLRTPHPMEDIVTPTALKEAQQKDETLHRLRELADTRSEKVSRNNGLSSFFYKDGMLYRSFHSPQMDPDTTITQVVVPKQYRKQVMQTAHENILGGHQGTKKTTEKILTNFFWPGMNSDITRYCRSCDVCQRTLSKGRVTKVPLGKMPLIEVPFERIAVDIVGPIHPMTDQKNRYILTVIDVATRYPEAIPLPSIETERVAEALVSIFTRVGIPKEMLTDQGTQFTSDLMKEVSKLLSIKHFTTSPYHPAANGLVERFNGTLKQMLKRMCAENPKDWDRYITPLLFAVREAPQESMGFSPFELLYGRKVRGPLDILRELWTGEAETGETKSTYHYVLDLRNRIDETCRNAHTQLQKSANRYAKYYNQKAKHRELQVGDKVLLLLPTDRNKLLLQWKGPFDVISKISSMDYRIDLNGKPKVFHINLLKKYHARNDVPSISDAEAACTAVIECEEQNDDEEETQQPLTNTSLLQPFPFQAKESLDDVSINSALSSPQKEQVNELLNEYKDVLSDLPGRTTLGEHHIKLKGNEHLKSKPYPIPHSLRDTVREEVKTMLSLGVIEPSESPIASPIVLVKKPDGSNRFCVDFRKLNKVTVFDAEPIPDQDELFTKVAHAKFFTKIDLSKGYWQVPMAAESKPLTAFLTPDGLFQFTMMPFGLVNAPASFSRLMRRLLDRLGGTVNYIDDILIYSTTWEEHLRTLTELFRRLRAAKLTARPSKCFIGQTSVEFLGHVIEHGQVRPRPEKLKAIQEVSQPQTKRELRSFLGMANYYRKFIPNYAAVAAPLTDRTRNAEPNKVKWETSQEQAFTTLKEKLSNPPILHLPDLSQDFILRTDASNVGLGAVLLQTHQDERFPVSYASRKLLRREQAYSTIERECLAVVWAVKKFEPYLYGRQFVLETDHHPLVYMNKASPTNGRLMRWILALQPYRFRVEAIRGSENVGADLLSRL
ncbi:uncharacterized protein [Diadema antillarum]|uniref:uncharacterized protein n=1 Tax=Diadema antillarum TaxID=105358 RepID=UPI003A8B1BAE